MQEKDGGGDPKVGGGATSLWEARHHYQRNNTTMTGGAVPSTNANNGDEDEAICCRSSHETDDGALDPGRRDLGSERLLSSRSLGLEDILEEETKEGDVQKTMDKSANRMMEKSSRRMLMDQTNSTHSRMAKLKRQNSKKISVGKVPRKKEPKEINWLRDTLSLNSSHTALAYQKEFSDDESVAGDGSSPPRHNKTLDTVPRQRINPLSKDLSLAFPKEKRLPQSLFSKVTSTCDDSLSSVSNKGLKDKTATSEKVRKASEEPPKHTPLWISIEPPEQQVRPVPQSSSISLPTKEQTRIPLSDQSRYGTRSPKEPRGGRQTPVESLESRMASGPYNRQAINDQYYSSHHTHRERESYSGGTGVVRSDHWQQQPPSVSRGQSGHSFSSRSEHHRGTKDAPPPPSPPQGSHSSSFSSAGYSTPYTDTVSGYNRVNFVSEHDRYGRYSTERHHGRYHRHHDDVRRGRYNHEDHGLERDGHGYTSYQPGLDNHRHQDLYQESDYLDKRRTMYQDRHYESHDRPHQHRVSSSREERHLEQKASTVRPADDDTVMVEIEPGFTVPLRNSAETFEAVSNDFYIPVMCLVCSCDIFCITDVQFVICPGCRVISPVEGDYFEGRRVKRHGLGLGFTCDSLFKMQSDIIARTRPNPNGGYCDSRSVVKERNRRESGMVEHVHHVPYHDQCPLHQQTAPRQHVFVHG